MQNSSLEKAEFRKIPVEKGVWNSFLNDGFGIPAGWIGNSDSALEFLLGEKRHLEKKAIST